MEFIWIGYDKLAQQLNYTNLDKMNDFLQRTEKKGGFDLNQRQT